MLWVNRGPLLILAVCAPSQEMVEHAGILTVLHKILQELVLTAHVLLGLHVVSHRVVVGSNAAGAMQKSSRNALGADLNRFFLLS